MYFCAQYAMRIWCLFSSSKSTETFETHVHHIGHWPLNWVIKTNEMNREGERERKMKEIYIDRWSLIVFNFVGFWIWILCIFFFFFFVLFFCFVILIDLMTSGMIAYEYFFNDCVKKAKTKANHTQDVISFVIVLLSKWRNVETVVSAAVLFESIFFLTLVFWNVYHRVVWLGNDVSLKISTTN